MNEIIVWSLGMAGIIGLTCFISWILEMVYD